MVTTLLSAADVETAQSNALPLAAIPKMSVPFGHPPAGSAGVGPTAAANLMSLGLCSSSTVVKAPLHPPPAEWKRYSCRCVDIDAVLTPWYWRPVTAVMMPTMHI